MFPSGSREPSALLALDKSPSDFTNTRAWKSSTSAANSARKLPAQPSGGWPLLAQHVLPARVHTAEPQAKGLRTAQKIRGSPRRHSSTCKPQSWRRRGTAVVSQLPL